MPFYAVRNGFEPGIYETWEKAEKQVKGFSNAKYKKFQTKSEAIDYILLKSPDSKRSHSTDPTLEIGKDNSHKSSPHKVSNLDLSKKDTNHQQETLKRKIDNFEASKKDEIANKHDNKNSSNSVSTESKEEKKAKTDSEQSPNTHKPVKSLTTQLSNSSPSKTLINNKPQTNAPPHPQNHKVENQKNYLTEYEDKKIDFSFKGEKMIVYTDGACSNNGKSTAIAGIGVFWGNNHPLNVSKRLLGVQTNNRAEITAAIVAISQAINYNASEITIYTDSQFMINCMSKWIKNWKANGWKTKDGNPVKNIDDLKRLDDLISKIKTNWEYVPGHNGVFGNEEADKLATQCLK